MKELKDTVYMMNSEDYKNRFKAEYWQTKIRYEKLKAFNTKIEAAEMTRYEKKSVEEPKHDCPGHLLRDQQTSMGHYLHILELRAEIEGIDLDDFVYGNICSSFISGGEIQSGTAYFSEPLSALTSKLK